MLSAAGMTGSVRFRTLATVFLGLAIGVSPVLSREQADESSDESHRAALAEAEEQIDAAELAGDYQRLGEAEMDRAEANRELERPALARQAFRRAAEAFAESGDSRGEMNARAGLGNTLADLEEYDRALHALYEALRLAVRLEATETAAELEGQIGGVHFHIEDIDAAETYFTRMRDRYEDVDDQKGYASALNNLAVIARHRDNLTQARALNQESLAIREEIGDIDGMAASYNNLAVLAWLNDNLEETARWHRRGLALYREVGNTRSESISLHNLAHTYLLMGEYERAEEHFEQSRALIEEIDSDNLRLAHFDRVAQLNAARDDYQAAFEARTNQLELTRSIHSDNRQRQIAEMRALFETEQREKEIRLLQQERQTQAVIRNALIAGAISLILILGLLWNRFRIKSRSNRVIAARNEELDAMDRIVATLNTEQDFASLLTRILEEAIGFFDGADRGAFMVRSADSGHFYPAVWKGYQSTGTRDVRLDDAQARGRYISGAESLTDGIYLRRRPGVIQGYESLQEEDPSQAMLAIAITVDGETAGYLILQSREREEAFNLADRDSFRRFREHAISAFRRARHLKQLAFEKERAEEARGEMERLARSDSLTGLPNRRHMQEKLQDERRRVERNGRPAAIVLCDIDRFKDINDSLGHEAGDAILKDVAARLRERLRAQDAVARWGGEEFLMLLPETDLDGAGELAESLRQRIADVPAHYDGQDISVTLSFGVAVMDPTGPVDDSIRQADEALYVGKRTGRNRVVRAPVAPADG